MKKVIILFVLLTSFLFPQSGGKWIIDYQVRTYTDSLQFENDGIAGKDSVWLLTFNFNPKTVKVFIKGNANAGGDSIGLQYGYDVYNELATTITETNWGSQTSVKDSAWNTVNVMINNTTGKDYTLYNLPAFNKLKFSLLNYRAAVPTRKVQVTIQAWQE
jgi:hypothetical protein